MSDAFHERFAQFFADTRHGLVRYVRRFTRSHEAAEDIVQEAYVRTLEQAPQVQAPKAFLFVTARHLAANARRHHAVAATETMGDMDALEAAAEHGASPEDHAMSQEAAALLRQAIERLPEQCRAAFTLKVFHACSYQEIADRLGISPRTVEKHIARGLHDTNVFMRRRYQLADPQARRP